MLSSQSVLQLHSLKTGELIQIFDLDVGSIVGFSGKKQQSEIFYHFMSFLTPGIIYHVDFKKQPFEPTVSASLYIHDKWKKNLIHNLKNLKTRLPWSSANRLVVILYVNYQSTAPFWSLIAISGRSENKFRPITECKQKGSKQLRLTTKNKERQSRRLRPMTVCKPKTKLNRVGDRRFFAYLMKDQV